MNKPKIIFFGNGPLADFALEVFKPATNIIFHAKTRDDLETVKELKKQHSEALGVLASFGVLIKQDVLDLFEPEGILNIHPSLLPLYRGASPIESAILNGDTDFSVSVMKLVRAMDAGPLYHQETISGLINPYCANPNDKFIIYEKLAKIGANWIIENINNLPTPTEQNNNSATYTQKFDKTMSKLEPNKNTAQQILRQIIAFSGFPKSKYTFYGQECIIHSAHIAHAPLFPDEPKELSIECKDGIIVYIDSLQPANRKTMDAKSFLNGLHL